MANDRPYQNLPDEPADGLAPQSLSRQPGPHHATGGEPGEVVFSLVEDAIAKRDFELAKRLCETVLVVERGAGRSTAPLVRRALRQLVHIELSLENIEIARHHARRLERIAPAGAERRAAKRLFSRVERESTSAASNGSRASDDQSDGIRSVLRPEPIDSSLTFADVGGMDSIKQQIHRFGILPLLDPQVSARYGVTAGGAILLYGPPGCGKTLIAQAAAGEMKAPLFAVRSADIMSPWMGMDERNLAAVFKAAREREKCILFLDELDAMAPVRTAMTVEARRSLVNALLVEMDGATRNGGCLIIGATNMPELIDPALKRRGRFDKLLHVCPPDRDAREAILRVKLAGLPLGSDVDMPELATVSDGLTGADIDGVVSDATEAAWLRHLEEGSPRDICMLDLLMSLSRSRVAGDLRRRIDERIMYLWGNAIDSGIV